MGSEAEVIDLIRAAFAPGADAATKQRAKSVLQMMISALDATPGAPLGVPPPVAAPAPAAPPAAALDPFGALIERYRSLLPPDAQRAVQDSTRRLTIPLIPIGPLVATKP